MDEPVERTPRGPVPEYSRAQLAAAAIAIADASGLAATSMRKVAAAVGAAPASLYRYVRSRDDLVALMADAAMTELDLPREPSGTGWRADVLVVAHRLRDLYRRHPWLLELTPGGTGIGPQLLGPASIDFLDAAVAAVAELERPGPVTLEAVAMLTGVVGLFARDELAGRQTSPEGQAELAAHLQRVLAAGRHPHLAQAVARPPEQPHEPENVFERVVLNVMSGLLGA